MKTLANRIAVISGRPGGDSGPGLAGLAALALAEGGCDVVVADLDQASAERTAAQVRARGRRAMLHAIGASDACAMAGLSGLRIALAAAAYQ